jgi:phage terminase large subunit
MIEVHKSPKFDVLYDLPANTNTVIAIGGRGGQKTYEVSKFLAFSATVRKKRTVVLRDEKALIKESILAEIFARYDTANESGALDRLFDKNEHELKDKKTGETLIYTKGFRASTTQKKANLKGEANIDIAVIEEAEDIRDKTKFNTFADSIRKEGSIIMIILNTPDIQHWIVKQFFRLEPVTLEDLPELKHITETDIDGYWKLVPKDIPGIVYILTSYEDNHHLAKHIIEKYRSYGDPDSHLYDLHYYLTAIKGFASSGRKGQILKKVKPISLKEYLALPYKEYFGQDFGTARPAGLVGVKKHRNTTWCRQLNYDPLPTLEIGKMYCKLQIHPQNDPIIADNADAKACDKLESGWNIEELSPEEFSKYPGLANGWFIVRARKGADSINYGIETMTGMNLYAVEESTDLWEEVHNYVYAQDKQGDYTNNPIDDFNHLIDPWRYVLNYLDTNPDSYGMERVN